MTDHLVYAECRHQKGLRAILVCMDHKDCKALLARQDRRENLEKQVFLARLVPVVTMGRRGTQVGTAIREREDSLA